MSTGARIILEEGEHGWVATDEETGISSQPVPTEEEALDDLKENLALERGELTLSEETQEALETSASQREAGNTIPAEEVYEELGLGE